METEEIKLEELDQGLDHTCVQYSSAGLHASLYQAVQCNVPCREEALVYNLAVRCQVCHIQERCMSCVLANSM